MSNTDQFDRALTTITQERGDVYGHPSDDFARAAAIKIAVDSCPDPRLRHVLDMIAVKMARLTAMPDHLDSWIDIAGYARTACMVLDVQDSQQDPSYGHVGGDAVVSAPETVRDTRPPSRYT
jgi:hypothetical protein